LSFSRRTRRPSTLTYTAAPATCELWRTGRRRPSPHHLSPRRSTSAPPPASPRAPWISYTPLARRRIPTEAGHPTPDAESIGHASATGSSRVSSWLRSGLRSAAASDASARLRRKLMLPLHSPDRPDDTGDVPRVDTEIRGGFRAAAAGVTGASNSGSIA